MAFKLKRIGEILGINEELSTYGRPVFEKDLEDNVIAEANKDGTTFVNKNSSKEQKEEAIEHEEVHHEQMERGDLDYTDSAVKWKGKTYSRTKMNEGSAQLPWEKEAYAKTKKK